MTPAKKLASHRFGEFRGVKPVWNRGFKGVSPLNPPVIPPKGGTRVISNGCVFWIPGLRPE